MLNKIKKSDWIIMGAFCAVLMPLIYPTFDDPTVFKKIVGVIIFTITQLIAVIIFVYYLFPRYFLRGQYVMLIISLFATITGLYFLQEITNYLILGHCFSCNSLNSVMFGIIGAGQNSGGFMAVLIGKQLYDLQIKLLAIQKEKKENELRWLKSQIDPHFLFNNLNILDILINTDPKKASIYTKKLSSLYRYLVRQKDQDVVSLEDEWTFAENYIALLKYRFNELFIFNNSLDIKQLQAYFVPPAALQVLLENIVKHNIADDNNPINIDIDIQDSFLVVGNTYRPKSIKPEGTNTGLTNLKERIRLLTDKNIIIDQNNQLFIVKVPLVKQVN